MNVIYIGGVPPKELQDKVKEYGSSTDIAGYTLQSAIVGGLDECYHNMIVLTTLWIESFPKSTKCFFRRQSFSHKEDSNNNDVFCGFINIPLIKNLTQYLSLKRELKKVIRKDEKNIIISYALTSYSLLAINDFRKHSQTCVIVPDLPEYMSDRKNFLYRMAKLIDKKLINRLLKEINSFVLLSPYMRERLPVGDKAWIQMEGIYNNNIEIPHQIKDPHKVILYTGNLGKRYGIIDLLDSFSLINNPDYRLWICGSGDGLDEILEKSKLDNRIVYLGLKSRQEVLVLQKQATLLINPRHSYEVYTKYSFPSKTIEYMASGTPTLMSKLACIPQEYDEYLYYFDDESVEGMKNKMIEICNKPSKELSDFGNRASIYIIKNNSADIKAKKIVELIDSLK